MAIYFALPHCSGDFVYPVYWHEATETHQVVLLRCGQCGTWRKDTFADDTLDRFDGKLDEAAARILDEADRLHREWQATEADAFAAALQRDRIDAADFAY